MRRFPLLLVAALAAAGCRPAPEPVAETPPYDPAQHEYAGSEACMHCHVEAFQTWKASSHATTVRPAEFADEELLETFIECSGMWFTHVLGDRHHVRFLVEDEEVAWGEGRVLALPCGWDVHEKTVTSHHPDSWRDKPWESYCAGCHVTGFRAEDHGFLEYGVGCEECHGPAQEHANTAVPWGVLSFTDSSAEQEVTVCASCHLQGGESKSTGLKLAPAYRAGGELFDDYEFDWASLDAPPAEDAKILDLHQKINVRDVVVRGDDSLRCTTCHTVHDQKHEKHRELPRQDYCLLCHQPDDAYSLKEYSQSCNVCEF